MAPPIVETRRKIVNVVGNCQSCRRGGGGGDLKYCRPENFLVCRKNFPPIVETRQKIVNVVGKFQSCRRGGGGEFKMLSVKYCLWPSPP